MIYLHLIKLFVCLVTDRLAIYYLNAVSKAYQNANMELKRKMQMVGKRFFFFVNDGKVVWHQQCQLLVYIFCSIL